MLHCVFNIGFPISRSFASLCLPQIATSTTTDDDIDADSNREFAPQLVDVEVIVTDWVDRDHGGGGGYIRRRLDSFHFT